MDATWLMLLLIIVGVQRREIVAWCRDFWLEITA